MASPDPVHRARELVARAREAAATVWAALEGDPEAPAVEAAAAAFVQGVEQALDAVAGIRERSEGVEELRRELEALQAAHAELEAPLARHREEVGERIGHLRQGGQTLKAYGGGSGSPPSYYFDEHG